MNGTTTMEREPTIEYNGHCYGSLEIFSKALKEFKFKTTSKTVGESVPQFEFLKRLGFPKVVALGVRDKNGKLMPRTAIERDANRAESKFTNQIFAAFNIIIESCNMAVNFHRHGKIIDFYAHEEAVRMIQTKGISRLKSLTETEIRKTNSLIHANGIPSKTKKALQKMLKSYEELRISENGMLDPWFINQLS